MRCVALRFSLLGVLRGSQEGGSGVVWLEEPGFWGLGNAKLPFLEHCDRDRYVVVRIHCLTV